MELESNVLATGRRMREQLGQENLSHSGLGLSWTMVLLGDASSCILCLVKIYHVTCWRDEWTVGKFNLGTTNSYGVTF